MAAAISPELKAEIEGLASLDLGDLRIRWRQHLRTAPPPHLSRPLMVRLLAYRIQARMLGDLDRDSARLLDRIAKERLRRRAAAERAAKPKAPPLVPPIPTPGLRPGTLLVREFGGEVHTVTVVAGGFCLEGDDLCQPVGGRPRDHRHPLERSPLLRPAGQGSHQGAKQRR